MEYKLEKSIWTETDFEQMGWHDCYIYKIRLAEDLELDIDYIFKWNKPDIRGLPFTFWIAPATLVFKAVKEVNLDFDILYEDDFQIEGIERSIENEEFNWSVITRRGEMLFKCSGYEQFIRQSPSYEFDQRIGYLRYGFSLERTTEQNNPNRMKEDILEKRKKEFDDYEMAKKRQLKRLDLEEILSMKEKGLIPLKEYLLKKKELNDEIYSYTYFLKDTRFENW